MLNGYGVVLVPIIAIFIVGLMLYRFIVARPVSTRDLIVPLLIGGYLAYRFVPNAGTMTIEDILAGVVSGIALGVVSGMFVRVWQHNESGKVFQSGGWRYAVVWIVLVAIRYGLRFALSSENFGDMDLNYLFIAMSIGVYIGRSITVTYRALGMLNWNWRAL